MSAHTAFYKKIRSKSTLYYVFCTLCISFVAGNIIASQQYNKNMYGVMSGENKSIINYLKHIWGTPLFNLEIEGYRAEGRQDVISEWESIQKENENKIKLLKSAVLLHPYSPELYYNLHLLYSENGDNARAAENLQKAQQIDPSLK